MTLFEQFHRICNIFFLFCAILQVFPSISSFDPVSGFLSVIWMLSITAVKTAYEDYKKHKDDERINSKEVKVRNEDSSITVKKWEDVSVGELLMIENDNEFPADVVLLDVKSSDGRCRIETSALDGETNMKFKCAVKGNISKEHFQIAVSKPVVNLSIFNGTIITHNQSISVDLNNFVPRGCVLRKTPNVLGLVVYTGNDCKIIMNSAKPHFKYTLIDKFLDRMAIFLSIVLLLICIGLTIGNYLWTKSHIDEKYLALEELSSGSYVLQCLSWILVLNMVIPLCVYTSLDLVRFFLAQTINNDKDMMENDVNTRCRNSDLVSSIGRITHMFSDKTGTLTKNRMTFKSFAFVDGLFGITKDENKKKPPTTFTNSIVNSERYVSLSNNDISWIRANIERKDVRDFLLSIVLCNSAATMSNSTSYTLDEIREVFPNFEFPLELPDPNIVAQFPYLVSYQTSSPDELALLHFARECGYILYSSSATKVCVIINNELVMFNRPIVFDFDSKRKRMSVLAKNQNDEKYTFYMKGADNVVLQRSSTDPALIERLYDITNAGLRSLCFASKEIDDATELINEYNQKKKLLDKREEAIAEMAEKVETDFKVFAFSGVEDELQDNVKLTLQRLRNANIKVWMLTGDKLDTAINIGSTSGLVNKTHKVITLTEEDVNNNFERLNDLSYLTTVLALEGSTVNEIIMNDEKARIFYGIAEKCVAIICARCEPCQKGNIVRTFMKYEPGSCTLAIGDGSNDVDMIRASNVGVGVEGNEGSDAVMSSDFSIPSFRHIAKLLIVHGRWCANRSAMLILLTFYKNFIIAMMQVFYGIFNGFSALPSVDSGFNSMYNFVLTIPQLFFICVFEEDITAKYALAVPQIYIETQKTGGLGLWDVLQWYLISIFHSLLIFFFSYFESSAVLLGNNSTTFDWAVYTQITGWTILFVFTFMLLLRFRTLTVIHVILYTICVVVYGLIEFIYSYVDPTLNNIIGIIFRLPRIWFSIPFVVGTVIIIDMIFKYLTPLISPSISDSVAELQHAESRMF